MRFLKAMAQETTKSERTTIRAVNLILTLTALFMLIISLYRNNSVYDIRVSAFTIIYGCVLQVFLWEDNFKE